jgi:phage tail sheath gpL-like
LNLRINTGRQASPIVAPKFDTLVKLIGMLDLMRSGSFDNQTLRCDVTPVAATGTITLSSSSGVLTATINGVALATASLSGTDTENAAAMAVVINASSNALVAGIVTATSALGVVTITGAVLGKTGNAVTTAGSGTGVTANQARLTGGSDGTTTSFVY